jgi:hypothetical protein
MFIAMGYMTAFVAMVIVVTGVIVDDVEDGKNLRAFTIDDTEFRKDRLQWLENDIKTRAANLVETGQVSPDGQTAQNIPQELNDLFDELVNKLRKVTILNQRRIHDAVAAITRCHNPYEDKMNQSQTEVVYFRTLKETFLKCQVTEHTWYQQKRECESRIAVLTSQHEHCLNKTNTTYSFCPRQPGESDEAYLQRVVMEATVHLKLVEDKKKNMRDNH